MRNHKTQEALEKVYEEKRADTIVKIKNAISEIRVTGEKLSINRLSKITGLSNAVFYKPHVQDLLKNEPEWHKVKADKSILNNYEVLEKSYYTLAKQIELERSKKQDLELALERKNHRIAKYEAEISAKDEELELLRGKYHALFTILEQISGFEGLDINIS